MFYNNKKLFIFEKQVDSVLKDFRSTMIKENLTSLIFFDT